MSYQLSEINRMAACAPETFLAEADAAFQEKICAAADKIEQNDYDLVLLDIMLPGLDGKAPSCSSPAPLGRGKPHQP